MTEQSRNNINNVTENKDKLNEFDAKVKSMEDTLKELQSEITICKEKTLPDLSTQISTISSDFATEKDKIVNELENKIKTHIDEINKIKERLAQLDKDYQDKYTTIENKTEQLTEFEQNSLELKDKIAQYHDEVFNGENSFKIKIENLYNDYIKKSQEINKLNSKIFITTNIKTDEIITKEEYDNLPANDKKKYQIENDQYVKFERRISIEEQINTINKKFALAFEKFSTDATNSLATNEDKNERLRNELQNMIEGLVSGATTAGLAKSHEKAKNDHIDEMKHWRLIFFLSLVGISIIFLIISFCFKFEFTLLGYIERILLLTPIILPLIWIATVANKNIHQNKRLYEEYLHKWAIAFTFDGLKREIEELDKTEDKEYIKKLLDEYLLATALNPSSTLEKNQKSDMPIENIVEQLPKITQHISQIKEIFNIEK